MYNGGGGSRPPTAYPPPPMTPGTPYDAFEGETGNPQCLFSF